MTLRVIYIYLYLVNRFAYYLFFHKFNVTHLFCASKIQQGYEREQMAPGNLPVGTVQSKKCAVRILQCEGQLLHLKLNKRLRLLMLGNLEVTTKLLGFSLELMHNSSLYPFISQL